MNLLVSRAKDLLGYVPKFDLAAGIEDSVDWYYANELNIYGE